jgi:hypothetical protein
MSRICSISLQLIGRRVSTTLRHSFEEVSEYLRLSLLLVDPDLLGKVLVGSAVGGRAVMDHSASHHADSRVAMVIVIPGEEGLG